MERQVEVVDWEAGSEFHFGCLRAGPEQAHPWTGDEVYGASGRDVLRSLIRLLLSQGVKRMWLPSYFCHEVVEAIEHEIMVDTFPDLPKAGASSLFDNISFESGDALLLVNQWGVRAPAKIDGVQGHGVLVVEDHTHDPWSPWAYHSQADYCVASLRKCLPIPDGGVLWSPGGRRLPVAFPLTLSRQQASHEKLSGMLLKSAYLRNESPEKELYRELLQSGEAQIAKGDPSGMSPLSKSLLKSMDVTWWRTRRLENLSRLDALLESCPLTPISSAKVPVGHVPLGAFFELPSAEKRDELRTHLIQQRIYPAVLWPVEADSRQRLNDERRMSERMLFLHVDGRYAASDIERIADVLCRWSHSA